MEPKFRRRGKKKKRKETMNERNVKKLPKVDLFPDLVFPLGIRAVSPQRNIPLSNLGHKSVVI
jgi:hypothetical protein